MVKLSLAAAFLLVSGTGGKVHNLKTTRRELNEGEEEWTALINADNYECPPNWCVTTFEIPFNGLGSADVAMAPCGIRDPHFGPDGINANNQKWHFRDAKPPADFAGYLSEGQPVYQIVSKKNGKCIGVDNCYSGHLTMVNCDGQDEAFTYWAGWTGGFPLLGLDVDASELNVGCWTTGDGYYVPFHAHCSGYKDSVGFMQIPEVVLNSVKFRGTFTPYSNY